MRIGFLVWNKFQIVHFAEIARQFDEPDFILLDRNVSAFEGFDPRYLAGVDAYTRFLSERKLYSVDGEYDAILTQFTPRLQRPWTKTHFVMCQYSLAKPKTAYNGRWYLADLGLVYGPHSASIIDAMCPTAQIGNPRFDPYFELRLDAHVIKGTKRQLDPNKKTVLYLPTWGDLSSCHSFWEAIRRLAYKYNVIYQPHHLTSLRDVPNTTAIYEPIITAEMLPTTLDLGVHLMSIADVVVSDLSGAIFDALYCRKPVVMLANGAGSYAGHPKADDSALEVATRGMIGPVVQHPKDLDCAVREMLEPAHPYVAANEELVRRTFRQRGECGYLAARAIRDLVDARPKRSPARVYAGRESVPSVVSGMGKICRTRAVLHNESSFQGGGIWLKAILFRESVRQLYKSLMKRCNKTQGGKSVRRAAWLAVGCIVKRVRNGNVNSGKSEMEGAAVLYGLAAGWSGYAAAKQIKYLNAIGNFYDVGVAIERWCSFRGAKRTCGLAHIILPSARLRYSRAAWRRCYADIVDYVLQADLHRERGRIQWEFGLVESAQATLMDDDSGLGPMVQAGVERIESLANLMEIAARNELVVPEHRTCIVGRYEQVPITHADANSLIEFSVLRSCVRRPHSRDQENAKCVLAQFERHCADILLERGFILYPRLQISWKSTPPISGRYPYLACHTTSAGAVNQVHFKYGTLANHVSLDSQGYSGWSSIADCSLVKLINDVCPREADHHWRLLYQTYVGGGLSKFEQSSSTLYVRPPYLFLPMQLVDDTVAQLASIDTISLLRELGQWACRSPYTVVVKRHPRCTSKTVAQVLSEEVEARRVVLTNANIHEIIAGAEAVVTVNSGVGAEALLQLKPVVCTGDADYAAACTRVQNVNELRAVLYNEAWRKLTYDAIKRFIWFYTKRYMPYYDDREAIACRLNKLVPKSGDRINEYGGERGGRITYKRNI